MKKEFQCFSITHSPKGKENLFAVNGCNSEWNIMKSRGCLPSVEYAVLYATEKWGLKVSDWKLYSSKPNESLFSKPRTREERMHARARKRMLKILEEFKYFDISWQKLKEIRKQNTMKRREQFKKNNSN